MAKRNTQIKLPAKWTPAHVRVNEKGKVQVKINPARLGSGGRFPKCVESVEARGGAYDAKAVCAAAGRKKYGKKKFAAMAAAGRRRKQNARARTYGWLLKSWPGGNLATYPTKTAALLAKRSIFRHVKGVKVVKVKL